MSLRNCLLKKVFVSSEDSIDKNCLIIQKCVKYAELLTFAVKITFKSSKSKPFAETLANRSVNSPAPSAAIFAANLLFEINLVLSSSYSAKSSEIRAIDTARSGRTSRSSHKDTLELCLQLWHEPTAKNDFSCNCHEINALT